MPDTPEPLIGAIAATSSGVMSLPIPGSWIGVVQVTPASAELAIITLLFWVNETHSVPTESPAIVE